jgi:peptidoglycan/LPS O-acetylase OafA/YrhL
MVLTLPGFRFDAENGLPAVTRCFTEFAIGLAVYRAYCAQPRGGWLSNDGVCFAVMAMCLLTMALRLDLPFVLATPVLILVLALNNGCPARLMAHPVLYFLGVVSFSLYLIHQLFRPIELEIVQALHRGPLSIPAGMAFALLGALSVIPFAWLSFTAIERPGRRIVRRIFNPA